MMFFSIAKLAGALIAAAILFVFGFAFGASLFWDINAQPRLYLSSPTEAQLKFHLTASGIRDMPYDHDNYNCVEYSNEAVAYLKERGIFSCPAYLEIETENAAHMIVAVELADGRQVFFDPQTYHILYNVELGDDYCEYLNWNCNWPIRKVSSCFGVYPQI